MANNVATVQTVFHQAVRMNVVKISMIACSFLLGAACTEAEEETVITESTYSKKTMVYKSLPDKALELDLFLPTTKSDAPRQLLIWVHGGAWMRGSKDEFMPKNGNLGETLLNEGYAIAAVNYRLSHEAIYPAQIQDINDAINYLMAYADTHQLNPESVVMMGRSAGAHLGSIIATSNTHSDTGLYEPERQPNYTIEAVVDFFGPSDLNELKGNSGKSDHDAPDAPEAKLLGISPRQRPDLARWASATTYVNTTTPPFIMMHGANDEVVPPSQSEYLKTILDAVNIENEIYIEPGARHGDRVFDSDEYVSKVVAFLAKHAAP